MQTITRIVPAFNDVKISATILDRGLDKWVIVTHGVGEYSGRHEYWFGEDFKDYNIVLYDLRGHGESEGERGYVHDFDDYLKDLDALILFLKNELKMKEFALFGHSMGGLIVARWIQTHPHSEPYPFKTILSAPGAGAYGVLGVITHNIPDFLYDKLISLPSIPLGGILDLKKLSHREEVYMNYVSDPKMILKVHTHLYFDLLKKAKFTFSRPLNPHTPLLVIIGSQDVIVNSDLVQKFFKTTEKRAKLVVVQDGYHELYMESEEYYRQFINEIKSFLKA